MSHYYYLYCKDCNEDHRFENVNRDIDVIRALIQHRQSIENLEAFFIDRRSSYRVSLALSYNSDYVDVHWFVKHRGHTLVPKDEYGQVYDVDTCDGCGTTKEELGVLTFSRSYDHRILCKNCFMKIPAIRDPKE